jgi:FHS family L-fucose permease-like MFS transporter
MRRRPYIVGLIFLIFFIMSFLTNILGPIVPDIIKSFRVSLGAAAFLPFSFFVAYGVMSIPAGFLVERFSEKPVILSCFAAATVGALSFALFPSYPVAIISRFAMGGSMATLQVAVNPLLRVSGGEEHFAFNSAFAQLVFGSASFLSPLLYSYIVLHFDDRAAQNWLLRHLRTVVPTSLAWVSMYWIFAFCTAAMVLGLVAVRFPVVARTQEEKASALGAYRQLLRRPMVWFYFFCVFAYVGSEQGTADWISKFLSQYHGYSPYLEGAETVSWFWGMLTAGCFVGMLLFKVFDSRRVLAGFSLGSLLALSAALFGSGKMALFAFPAVGFFASIMWPTISSLALNSVAENQGAFSGILCTGIVGGAVVPLLIGHLGDRFGLRSGMLFLYFTFGCVMSVGFWAKPLIENATVRRRAATPDRAVRVQSK